MQNSTANAERFRLMTTAAVNGLIVKLAIPSIAIMIVSALYNMADTYFVGSLGTSPVAAVGIAFPLMAIIQALGFFFGQGTGNYVSRALGAQDTDNASRMAATGFIASFIAMLLLAIVGIIFLNPLVLSLGATSTILPYAREYILYILIASPWLVSSTVLNQLLRFQGAANIAMIGMISGAVLNIFLDPLFIYTFGMGIKGAAIATMVSQMVSFSLLLFYGCNRAGNIRIRLSCFSLTRERFKEMFRGGIPALLRQGLLSLATIVINHFAGVYGDEAIAAISIVQRLSMFANATILGFGQGFQPVCGFNYGAQLYARVKQGYWFSVRVTVVVLLVVSVLMAIYAPEIIALFRSDDPEVIRIGTIGLRLQCISMPFIAWVIMINMLTQTIGKAFYASINAISRQGIFLLPLLLLLTKVFDYGLLGIQLSLPLSDICGFLLSIPIAVKVLKEMKTG